jgi:hypothetical protein
MKVVAFVYPQVRICRARSTWLRSSQRYAVGTRVNVDLVIQQQIAGLLELWDSVVSALYDVVGIQTILHRRRLESHILSQGAGVVCGTGSALSPCVCPVGVGLRWGLGTARKASERSTSDGAAAQNPD